jgi:hypothetical protein
MAKANKQPWRHVRSRGVRVSEVHSLLNTLRVLDRTVMKIFMNIYRVPHRDQAAMLEQHRRLHDTVRLHLPRLLSQLQKVC